jgi:hypothetical protein
MSEDELSLARRAFISIENVTANPPFFPVGGYTTERMTPLRGFDVERQHCFLFICKS